MKFRAVRLYNEEGKRVSRMVEQSIDDLDPGNVVIKSHYAAVNYKDARAVTGVGNVISRFPCIPGVEVAGEVVESADPSFKPGDLVTVQGGRDFGMRRDGGYSEYVRVPGEWVGRIPQGEDPFDSVAMGLAAYTSALAVDELLLRGVTPDKGPILVTGGTGGSSSFAIDMASGTTWWRARGKPQRTNTSKASGRRRSLDATASRPATSPSRSNAGRALSTRSAASLSTRF